jgi:hypothetical protein
MDIISAVLTRFIYFACGFTLAVFLSAAKHDD